MFTYRSCIDIYASQYVIWSVNMWLAATTTQNRISHSHRRWIGMWILFFLSITKQDKDSETSSCHIWSLICITMYKFIQLPLCCIHLCDNNPKPLFQIAKKNLKFFVTYNKAK